jgi:hypothetical protein
MHYAQAFTTCMFFPHKKKEMLVQPFTDFLEAKLCWSLAVSFDASNLIVHADT